MCFSVLFCGASRCHPLKICSASYQAKTQDCSPRNLRNLLRLRCWFLLLSVLHRGGTTQNREVEIMNIKSIPSSVTHMYQSLSFLLAFMEMIYKYRLMALSPFFRLIFIIFLEILPLYFFLFLLWCQGSCFLSLMGRRVSLFIPLAWQFRQSYGRKLLTLNHKAFALLADGAMVASETDISS